jgi:thiosulfate/3-mercaptopyruvate sulfurtransferase
MQSKIILRTVALAAVAALFAFASPMRAQGPFGSPSENSAFSIPQADVMQPAELNRVLHASGAAKPLVLQVGSRVLFDQAHISGSEYVGAGSQPAGLQQLQKRVSMLPRGTLIVLYCGCCPWNRCPNVGPAYHVLRSMGFSKAKVLYFANNLGTDWVDHGYPVERSH